MNTKSEKLSTDLSSHHEVSVGVYGYPMKKIMGRFTDWRRERRILELTRIALYMRAMGYPRCAREVDAERIAEINARSPAQVERMERRMGLR